MNFVSSIASMAANYVLLEGGALRKLTLVKTLHWKKLACIPCYHDTDSTIKQTIINYSKKFNLKIDNDSINYLSQKLGNDKLSTLRK